MPRAALKPCLMVSPNLMTGLGLMESLKLMVDSVLWPAPMVILMVIPRINLREAWLQRIGLSVMWPGNAGL